MITRRPPPASRRKRTTRTSSIPAPASTQILFRRWRTEQMEDIALMREHFSDQLRIYRRLCRKVEDQCEEAASALSWAEGRETQAFDIAREAQYHLERITHLRQQLDEARQRYEVQRAARDIGQLDLHFIGND